MALPHYAYGDPAKIVENQQLHRLGCAGCARAEWILDRPMCPNALKYPACKQDDKRGYVLSAAAGGVA